MQKEVTKEKDCNYCQDRAKLMFCHYKRNAEEEGKYTTLVFSLGYVTMMTIYSTMYHYLTFQRKSIFICFLFISLSLFVLNEIWKMLMGILIYKHEGKLWEQHFTDKISLDKLEKQDKKYWVRIYNIYENAYPFIFIPSLIFGVLAAILLFLEALYLTF